MWDRKERLLDLSTTPQCHNGFDLFVVPLICINLMHFPRVLLGLKWESTSLLYGKGISKLREGLLHIVHLFGTYLLVLFLIFPTFGHLSYLSYFVLL